MHEPKQESTDSADKFIVRMPPGMRAAIAKQAEGNGRSMNSEIVAVLSEYISGELIPVSRLAKEPAVRNLLRALLNMHDERTKPKRRR